MGTKRVTHGLEIEHRMMMKNAISIAFIAATLSIVSHPLATPIKSKIPLPVPTPSQPAHQLAKTTPLFLDTPRSNPKRGKLRKGRTPVVATLRSNKKWMPY